MVSKNILVVRSHSILLICCVELCFAIGDLTTLAARPSTGGGALQQTEGTLPAPVPEQNPQRVLSNRAVVIARLGPKPADDSNTSIDGSGANQLLTDWQTIFAEDFEGSWPGPWQAYDVNFQNGSDFWSRVTCAPGGAASGVGAAWCAGQGDRPACGSSYDDNMHSWMIVGPFNLSNAVAADLQLKFIDNSEPGFDHVGFMFSTDATNFYGQMHSGTTPGYPSTWRDLTLDLHSIPLIGDITNQPLVWFGILFESDSAQSAYGGAYVDDIVFRRQVVNGCGVTQVSPYPGSQICFPQAFSWSTSGNCGNLWLAFRADPSSTHVIAIPVSSSGATLEDSEWAEINLFIGSAPSYEWAVGEIFGDWFFQRSPWRAFTVCLPCPGEGACCNFHPTPGCDDATCCQTVCNVDASCCQYQWDAMCTIKAHELCGCLLCGNGECGLGEDCANCPVDCSHTGSSADCNGNGVADGCDIQLRTSRDCNADGIPDECLGTVCPPYQNNDAFTSNVDRSLFKLNLATGATTFIGQLAGLYSLRGLAIDPTNGDFFAQEQHKIVRVDPTTGTILWSGNHGVPVGDARSDIAFDAGGNLFMIYDSTTYSVNKATGAATVLGSNSLSSATALTFSPDGRMFAVGKVASLGGQWGLVRLDPANGSLAEVFGPMTPEIGGIAFDSRGILFATNYTLGKLYVVSPVDASSHPITTIASNGFDLTIFRDCNSNSRFDSEDIRLGYSQDLDGNGIPDECAFCGDGVCNIGEDACLCSTDCGAPATSEVAGLSCTDGIDNDCDGTTDCADTDCFFDAACLPPPTRGGPGDILMANFRYDGITGMLLHTFPTGSELQGPAGLAIGPDGQLYIAGTQSRNIVRFDLARGFRYGSFVQPGSGGLFDPAGITFGPDGKLYVADRTKNRVMRYNGSSGAFIDEFVPQNSGGLFWAGTVAFGLDGNLYVSSIEGHAILRYNGQTGAFMNAFVPQQSGGLMRPYGFVFGPDGNLYVTHGITEGAVYRFNGTTGAFMDLFVPPQTGGLRTPHSIAFGPNGDLYVGCEYGGTWRFSGQTGALLDQACEGNADYMIFQPAQCHADSECDDANPDTVDVCYGYACKHPTQTRYYVRYSATGANNGRTWSDAFTSLQSALDAAKLEGMPAEIWLAAGVYTPNRGAGSRTDTFQLLDGLSLYGGFSGAETSLDQRQPGVNQSVLSGDMQGNDGAGFANYGDNCYHVVTAQDSGFDAPTLIDGVVITGGNADGPNYEQGYRDKGGGMLVHVGHPTVLNCTFAANRGKYGGAVYVEWSAWSVAITNTRFVGNAALTGGIGGGISSDDGGMIAIAGCAFSGNSAPKGGAGAIGGRSTWSNCSVVGNTATIDGGGLNNGGVSTTINNCIFWNNSDAGGVDESAQIFGPAPNLVIRDCCIEGWTGNLGGIGNTGDCEPAFFLQMGRDGNSGTLDDNLRLGDGSPNINSGYNEVDTDAYRAGVQALPATDLGGMPRIMDLVIDRGAYEFFVDCNHNGVLDADDIASSTSLDLDNNGVPDECPPPSLLGDTGNPVNTRFISFLLPAGWGAETAVRVTLTSLHHVSPPYTGGASVPFTLFEGQSLYAGTPIQYVESASSGTPLYASQLQCAPHYRDWSTITLLHVTGEAIVPSSTYQVENLAASCAGNESSCTAVSAALQISTTRWGDVETPYNPPATDPQPDTSDISALVNKFKSALGAPIKARALLAGGNARGTMGPAEISPDMSFTHISLCVDAFKGLPYPYKPGKCAGDATKACITEADCTNAPNPTTGPCILCP